MIISIATGLGVAFIMACYAVFKGRTGWHWFGLSLFAFAAVWLLTVAALDLAGVPISMGSRKLTGFAGVLTCLIVLIILVSVPPRPRRRIEAARRSPSR